GTVTSAERRGPLADKGIEGIVFDGSAPSRAVAERLRESDALLVSVPPDAGGDPALVCHGADIAAAPRLSWIGYLSTV
ncbi:Rossmann-fold NAD(P)-binding domain-containing protein, partial [Vibrio cholerae]|uniref:hypothetical protein n=1 Tax=Vibrio cholerae TaxID=666 RepID=UPI001F3EB727